MLPVALGLALIMLLAVGRGGEMADERAPQKPGPEPGPPLPDESKELSPMALERKRIIVQKGFLAAQQKLSAWLTANRRTQTSQQITNSVASYFRSRSIPLEAPNPRVPFWALPETQIASVISKVVNGFNPTIVDIGPAKIAGRARVGQFPTYIGVGRPRPRGGMDFPTAFDTEFRTAMDLAGQGTEFPTAFDTEFRTAMDLSGRGTEDPTVFNTDFNTEFRT